MYADLFNKTTEISGRLFLQHVYLELIPPIRYFDTTFRITNLEKQICILLISKITFYLV